MSWRLTSKKYLQGFWPLNNHVRDLSGKGNNGTNSGVTFTDGPYGKSVGLFNGTTSDIVLAAQALPSPYSISFWANPIVDLLAMIIGLRDVATDYLYLLGGTKLKIQADGNGLDFTVDSSFKNRDRHYVLVADGVNTTLYIDAQFSEVQAGSYNFDYDNIGDPNAAANAEFEGNMWNVRVYNMAATYDEVIALNRMDKRI